MTTQPPGGGPTSVGDDSRRANSLELLLALVAAIAYIRVIGWVIIWLGGRQHGFRFTHHSE